MKKQRVLLVLFVLLWGGSAHGAYYAESPALRLAFAAMAWAHSAASAAVSVANTAADAAKFVGGHASNAYYTSVDWYFDLYDIIGRFEKLRQDELRLMRQAQLSAAGQQNFQRQQRELLQELHSALAAGKAPNAVSIANKVDPCPLHMAARVGWVDGIAELVTFGGANVNSSPVDMSGFTALYAAVRHAQVGSACMLIRMGANPLQKGKFDKSALKLAVDFYRTAGIAEVVAVYSDLIVAIRQELKMLQSQAYAKGAQPPAYMGEAMAEIDNYIQPPPPAFAKRQQGQE